MITQEKSATKRSKEITTLDPPPSKFQSSSKKPFTLRTKATLLAIAIGVIPVATVGMLAFNLLNRSLTEQISQEQLEKNEIAADSVTRFLEDRIKEVETLAKNPLFTNPKLRETATLAEKAALLDRFAEQLDYYNSILFFDLQGDALFQASIEEPYTENYSDRAYFQEAIKTKKMTINGPGISSSSGQLRVEFAAPVIDEVTGELIGIVRAKIPGNYINSLFEVYQDQNKHWYLVNEEGTIFAGDLEQKLNQSLATYFPKIAPLHRAKENGVLKTEIISSLDSDSQEDLKHSERHSEEHEEDIHREGDKQLVSYTVAKPPAQFPNLHLGTLLTFDEDVALAPIGQLGWTIFLGTAVAAIVVSAIAIYLANRATRPLINAVDAVKKIGSGELDTRLKVTGKDELAELGSNINLMAMQIKESIEEQQFLANEQRQQKEHIEEAIYTLITEVSDATEGDLTVRANLESIELSTVADLFNAVISNLQEIAIKAKQSTDRVGSSLKQNESAIRILAQQATAEATETRKTLASIEQMNQSIQTVTQNANEAEQIVDDTYKTVLNSTENMDLTVESILNLRTIVGETAKKMKRLAESSQQVSQVVSFIEEIALKTNILAINATVEAGRAGEYGQGFTIVAEQVGVLAEQSAAATQKIADIVAAIQSETLEVSQAMELSTVRVVDSTRLVESTKENLNLILEKSQKINQLMESISQSTSSQTKTAEDVTGLMQKIARLSEITSQSSQQVAQSIVDTALVTRNLESTVAQFKVSES